MPRRNDSLDGKLRDVFQKATLGEVCPNEYGPIVAVVRRNQNSRIATIYHLHFPSQYRTEGQGRLVGVIREDLGPSKTRTLHRTNLETAYELFLDLKFRAEVPVKDVARSFHRFALGSLCGLTLEPNLEGDTSMYQLGTEEKITYVRSREDAIVSQNIRIITHCFSASPVLMCYPQNIYGVNWLKDNPQRASLGVTVQGSKTFERGIFS